MTVTFNIFSLVNLLGAVNGIFIALVILGLKKRKKTTKNILAGLIAMFTLIVASFLSWQTGLYLLVPHLIGILPNIYLTLGPLLFLYVKALTTPGYSWKKIELLHFLPFVLNFLYLLPFYLQSGVRKIAVYDQLALRTNLSYHLILVLRLLHLTIYLACVIKILRKYQYQVRQQRSTIEKIKLSWLYQLSLAMAALLAAYLIFYLSSLQDISSSPYSLSGNLFGAWHTMIIFFIGYRGLGQPDIFSSEEDQVQPRIKYLKSTLQPDQAKKYLEKLLNHMNSKKPYLEPGLTLRQLAEELSISLFHLSQIINQQLGCNFYDFINRYRVEEAKERLKLLPGESGLNILDVAFDSGFNSKSAFNQIFKKFTKTTPSKFIQNKES